MDLESVSFSSNKHQTIAATPLDFSDDKLCSVVGACKGLVLTDRPLEIWNPLTNEQLDLHLDLPSGHTATFGLGYDYITDDYKAVSILSTCQTDVYSLKSDSWRTITNCPQFPKGPGVFVCGALNRISCKDDNTIVALDLGTEKYTLLQTPPRWRDRFRSHDDTFLDVLGGCLILCASGYNCSVHSQLDVWVMNVWLFEASWLYYEERGGQNAAASFSGR